MLSLSEQMTFCCSYNPAAFWGKVIKDGDIVEKENYLLKSQG